MMKVTAEMVCTVFAMGLGAFVLGNVIAMIVNYSNRED